MVKQFLYFSGRVFSVSNPGFTQVNANLTLNRLFISEILQLDLLLSLAKPISLLFVMIAPEIMQLEPQRQA